MLEDFLVTYNKENTKMELILHREDLKEEYKNNPMGTIKECWKFKEETIILQVLDVDNSNVYIRDNSNYNRIVE
jgi:hypothetical protein